MALALAKLPKTVPAVAYVGQSLAFRQKFDDFPVATWSASIYFQCASGHLSIAATEESNYYRFETNNFVAEDNQGILGDVDWFIRVTDGTEKHIVARGTIEVKPDPTSDDATDFRSHVKKTLDAIRAVLEGTATHETQSYTIATSAGSRSLSRVPRAELLELEREYSAKYRAEVAKARQASGKRKGNTVKTRFSRIG